MVRVLLAGGGSAGHTSPMIATADALRRSRADVDLVCLGTPRGLETTVVPDAGYRLELIPPVPLPRRPSADLLRVPVRLRSAVAASRQVLRQFGADVVVGFGGYVCTPAYLAARRAKVPLVIHEGNARPGLANRVGARLTRSVYTSFPDTPLAHAHFIGLPLRRAISTLDREAQRPSARQHFGLEPDRPTLLVTGGSQGARRINDALSASAHALRDAGIQVLHAIGPKGSVSVPPEAASESPPYVVRSYIDRMDLAYAAADLVVGRAGANSVSEAAALGLPAVFVPLPIGNGEQALNARAVVAAGGARLVRDESFTGAWVAREIPSLLADPDRLAGMAAAASHLIRRDADDVLAAATLEAAGA